jgi:DNA modification methylase
MVAAHQMGRNCYGMELDEKYCQVIVNRMQELDPLVKITINGISYN